MDINVTKYNTFDKISRNLQYQAIPQFLCINVDAADREACSPSKIFGKRKIWVAIWY